MRAVIAVLAAACACEPVPDLACGPATATVTRVIDGDTIVVTAGAAGPLTIRYLLVDTPETTDGHHDCYGANASAFNTALVLGRAVAISYHTVCTDRYGRTLAYVRLGDVDVNRTLLERGYACLLHIPPDGDDRAADFAGVEAEARAAGRGLWSACDPVPCVH